MNDMPRRPPAPGSACEEGDAVRGHDGPRASAKASGGKGAGLTPRNAAWLAVTVLLGIAGGFLAARINMPLPWMLGPFLVCGVASLAGAPLRNLPMGRELGQVVIGLAIGLRFTAPVLAATLTLLPAMVLATGFVLVMTMLAAFLLMPLGRLDARTSFFATTAVGMADMATVASRYGGDPDSVAVVHALRIASVVSVVPFLVVAFGEPGGLPLQAVALSEVSWPALILGLVLAYAAALLVRYLPIPNPWLLGPVALGAALAALEILAVAVPSLLLIVAQIAIGISLGCRFRRDLLGSLPRVVAAGLVVSTCMISAAAFGAFVLSSATGLDYTTSFLAMAPAAMTEMVITAKAMGLDPAVVTAFHVMRLAILALTILPVFNLFMAFERWVNGPRT